MVPVVGASRVELVDEQEGPAKHMLADGSTQPQTKSSSRSTIQVKTGPL